MRCCCARLTRAQEAPKIIAHFNLARATSRHLIRPLKVITYLFICSFADSIIMVLVRISRNFTRASTPTLRFFPVLSVSSSHEQSELAANGSSSNVISLRDVRVRVGFAATIFRREAASRHFSPSHCACFQCCLSSLKISVGHESGSPPALGQRWESFAPQMYQWEKTNE